MKIVRVMLVLLTSAMLMSEVYATGSYAKYEGVPVLSRKAFVVKIDPKPRTCYGPFFDYKCFAGRKRNGTEILFYDGIEGYRFRPGRSHRIVIEEIQYDPTHYNMPTDSSGVSYRRVK